MHDLDWLEQCPWEGDDRPEWVDWLPTCPPRYATPRTWDRPTLGPQVAQAAKMLGWKFMPWQQFVADVTFEYEWRTVEVFDLETESDIEVRVPLLIYKRNTLTVPRQAGKTTLGLPIKVHRALFFPDTAPSPYGGQQVVVYTAQDRNHARKKFVREHVKRINNSPKLEPLVKHVRTANGSEEIEWKNGSYHGIAASNDTAGHGDTLDLGFMDEGFAIESDVEGAMNPAAITRPNSQLWVASTQGDDKHVWFLGKCQQGRLRVREAVTSLHAYFEWAAPEDAGSFREVDWRSFHPACGFTQTPESLVASAEDMEDPLDAKRAFYNWHRSGDTFEPSLNKAKWAACADPESVAMGRVALVPEVNRSGTRGTIATAGRNRDRKYHVEVVELRDGTDWMLDRLAEIFWNHDDIHEVTVDKGGPAGFLVPLLEEQGIPVVTVGPQQVAHACGLIYSAVENGNLNHLDQRELNEAAESARKKESGDVWYWYRGGDDDPEIIQLIAATIALGRVPTLTDEDDETPPDEDVW